MKMSEDYQSYVIDRLKKNIDMSSLHFGKKTRLFLRVRMDINL